MLMKVDEKCDEIKIIDFGLSKKLEIVMGEVQKLTTVVGTPYYVAPEVLVKKYD